MKRNTWILPAVLLAFCLPPSAANARDKKHLNRAMVENMVAVPCGAKQHGITGLGSLWASAGLEHVNSDEKLCPQYLLRTDQMEYEVRPADLKHPVLLPVGQEGEFKIKKDRLLMKIVDGDRKTRAYQVVAITPMNAENVARAGSRTSQKPVAARPPAPDPPPVNTAQGATTARPPD